MEEKTEKKTIKERFNSAVQSVKNGFKKAGRFIVEHQDSVVQIGVGVLGVGAAIAGIIEVKEDHKMTREEQKFERCHIYDYENYMDLYLDEELTTKDRLEIIEREKHGESRIDILQDMNKLI